MSGNRWKIGIVVVVLVAIGVGIAVFGLDIFKERNTNSSSTNSSNTVSTPSLPSSVRIATLSTDSLMEPVDLPENLGQFIYPGEDQRKCMQTGTEEIELSQEQQNLLPPLPKQDCIASFLQRLPVRAGQRPLPNAFDGISDGGSRFYDSPLDSRTEDSYVVGMSISEFESNSDAKEWYDFKREIEAVNGPAMETVTGLPYTHFLQRRPPISSEVPGTIHVSLSFILDRHVVVVAFFLPAETVNQAMTASLQTWLQRIQDGQPSAAQAGVDDFQHTRRPVASGAKVEKDTDGDGLIDLFESLNGMDFTNPDTDGDSFTDRTEVYAGFDPKKGNTRVFDQTVLATIIADVRPTAPVHFSSGVLDQSEERYFLVEGVFYTATGTPYPARSHLRGFEDYVDFTVNTDASLASVNKVVGTGYTFDIITP